MGSKLAQKHRRASGQRAEHPEPAGELTPFGPKFTRFRFRVVGIFESGFADVDSQWAFASLHSAEEVFSVDAVNAIEIRLDDIFQAPAVADAADQIIGPNLTATTWMEQFTAS